MRGEGEMECEGGGGGVSEGREGWGLQESKGEVLLGSDGGRENSPGLVVAHVCLHLWALPLFSCRW